MTDTAIAFFAYNRPDHAARTLAALAANDAAREYPLYAFCDGPKPHHRAGVEQTRRVLAQAAGFRDVTTVFSEQNRGCALSIKGGLDRVFAEYERVIVVEDDILTSPHFIPSMQAILDHYADDSRVFGGTGACEPLVGKSGPPEYAYDFFFVPRPSSHGWCTWRDRWQHFIWHDAAMDTLPRDGSRAAVFATAGEDLPLQLELLRRGLIDSWAIRWAYTLHRHRGLFLYPVEPLIANIGLDGTGLHSRNEKRPEPGIVTATKPHRLPPLGANHPAFLAHFRQYYRLGLKKRLIFRFMTLFPKADISQIWRLRRLLR